MVRQGESGLVTTVYLKNVNYVNMKETLVSLFDYGPARGESTVQNRCCIVLKKHTHLVICFKIRFWIQSLAGVTVESAVICCAACYAMSLCLCSFFPTQHD